VRRGLRTLFAAASATVGEPVRLSTRPVPATRPGTQYTAPTSTPTNDRAPPSTPMPTPTMTSLSRAATVPSASPPAPTRISSTENAARTRPERWPIGGGPAGVSAASGDTRVAERAGDHEARTVTAVPHRSGTSTDAALTVTEVGKGTS